MEDTNLEGRCNVALHQIEICCFFSRRGLRLMHVMAVCTTFCSITDIECIIEWQNAWYFQERASIETICSEITSRDLLKFSS